MADRERSRLIYAHQEWLGFVQPVGLVVAPNVLVDAQVVPDRNIAGRQREFQTLVEENKANGKAKRAHVAEPRTAYRVPGTPRASLVYRVLREWLDWEDEDLVDAESHPKTLEISLPELDALLSPTWAVPGDRGADPAWTMLIRVEAAGADFDRPPGDGWQASRQARFERLLRRGQSVLPIRPYHTVL